MQICVCTCFICLSLGELVQGCVCVLACVGECVEVTEQPQLLVLTFHLD